ncbi:MAG TPA: SDR family oxidoreductase [Roseiflexaceae bacterium]|nr:SDR family oxidoreductase [Roseiflexaceae bacterium]
MFLQQRDIRQPSSGRSKGGDITLGGHVMFSMEWFRLDHQNAFVTGAGSGIGQGIAIGLAQAGANVACFDVPTSRGLLHTVSQIQGLGRTAVSLTGDVTRAMDLQNTIATSVTELGSVDVAVNCAGIANATPAEAMPLEQWQRMIDINLTGVFLSCQAEAQVMLPRRRGSIINIASMSGVIVNRGLTQAHYNSSKAAVIHLSKSLAMEWSARGIRVNTISPGYTLTPMNQRPEVAEQLKAFAADTPLGRIASVDEMIGPAIFLASQASAFCTGVNLLVDGGFVCW